MASVGDWDELIGEAEAKRFVGREQELETFRQQISLTKPRYLIFYITGQGGAGKSTLLNRYRKIVQEFGFLLADCDEQQRDVPAVLGRFAHHLDEQDFPLKHFNERYKTYRQKMNEIESDPNAPQGLSAILGRTMVGAAYIAGDLVPGVSKGLDFLPHEPLETKAIEWVEYLAKKFTNKEELALVRDPVPILTSLFFKELNELVQRKKVLLCFDNFEATRPELQVWLLHLSEYKPSQNIRIAIAGRNQPGAKWEPLQRVTLTIRIDIFTEQEAVALLDAYDITDIKRRKEILELSGRLPVLMSWLAAVEGNEASASLPTHDIVERFLRWVTGPALKQVALLAAIPRTFNADILKLLLEKREQTIDEQSAFDWLQTMPFVKQSSEGWHYHDVVRRMMLHYQRQKSPETYRQTHVVLANLYNTKRLELSSSEEEQWRNIEWRKYSLAYAYHYLVADPNKHWGEVMSLLVVAIRKRFSFAVEMIEMLNSDNIQDELSSKQRGIVQLFRQQLQAIIKGRLQDGFEMFNKLCGINGLSYQAKGYSLANRGDCHRLDGKWDEALSDYEMALHYIPEDASIIACRGLTYLFMEHYQEAATDFDRVISLDYMKSWIFAQRGETYREMGHYDEALADFNQAIAHDGQFAWAIAHRGETYRQMGHYDEALADFDLVIALDEQNEWAIIGQGEAYLQMGRYEEALVNFDRAIALEEQESWYWYCRALVHMLTGRTGAFESDIQSAIEIAKSALPNTLDNWRIGFDFALYNLVAGNSAFAESHYKQLALTCSLIPKIQVAIADLSAFLTIQPSNELAQLIRTQLQTRIEELKQSTNK